MFILLKQIFRTLLKNWLLVISLFLIISVIYLIASASLQLTLSINNSIRNILNNGNGTNVVSKTLNSIGNIKYEYNDQIVEKNKVVTLDLQLNKTNDHYEQFENTLFPYEYSDFYYQKNNKETSIKSEIQRQKMFSGIKINKDAADINERYQFLADDDYSNGYQLWKAKPGTIRTVLLLSNANRSAVSYSFVNDDGNVLLNPNTILFNSYGYPIALFGEGSIKYEFTMAETISALKKNLFDSKSPKTEFPLQRATGKTDLHNITTTINTLEHDFTNYKYTWHPLNAFMLYSKVKDIPSYHFSINWDETNEQVKYLINNEFLKQENIDILNDAFDNLFYKFKLGLKEDKKSDVKDSLYFDTDKKDIVLSLPDEAFIDYNDNTDFDTQIKNKKNDFLNTFGNFLSIQLSGEINNIFEKVYQSLLEDNQIILESQKEYLYTDPITKHDLLFVEKYKSENNKIVLKSGVNFNQSDLLNIGNLQSDQIWSAFVVSKEYYFQLQLIWKKILDMIPTTDSNYDKYGVILYSLNQVVNELKKMPDDEWMLNSNIINNKYFIYFTIFNYFFKYNFSNIKIMVDVNFDILFNTISFSQKIEFPNLDNLFVILSNAYADKNNKWSLPTKISEEEKNKWVNIINLPLDDFKKSIDNITNKNDLALPVDFIKKYFTDSNKLNYLLDNLPNNYSIEYKGAKFIICGTGLSPDYAFPVISETSPIPDPKIQGIVYTNKSIFDSLGITSNDINTYYTYSSNSLNKNEIIKKAKNIYTKLLGYNQDFNIYDIKDAKSLGKIWMRSYFPIQLRNFIIIAAIAIIVFLLLLSFVIIYLLIKSIANNLMQPLAIVLSNGISLRHIILSCIANISVITILGSICAYLISFFTQNFLLSILSPLIFVPISIIPFNPLILFGIIILSTLMVGGLFAWILSRKFKSSVTQIIAKHDSPKESKIWRKLLSINIKFPIIPKASIAFGSTLFGRLMLLSILGSVSLGLVVSTIIIQNKFVISKTLTNDSRKYFNQIDLIDIKEQTGLYKPQPYNELGTSDPEKGINSLYDGDKYPFIYNDEMLKLLAIDELDNTKTKIKEFDDGEKSLTNLVLPSWRIYNELTGQLPSLLFNSVASLFTLDFNINILGQDINLWNQIKIYFPEWLVYQFETQIKTFKQMAMNQYGEIYTYFLNDQSIDDNDNDPKTLLIENIDYTKNGCYYPVIESGIISKTTYVGKPFFIWSDNNQKFHRQNGITYNNVSNGESIKLDLNEIDKLEFNSISEEPVFGTGANSNKVVDFAIQKKTLNNPNLNNVKWKWVPAYSGDYTFNREKTAYDPNLPNQWDSISLKKSIMQFICLLFGDDSLAEIDAKISFGIVPVNKDDETYTNVDITINSLYDIFNNPYTPKVNNAQIVGINKNSKLVVLKDRKNKNLINILKDDNISNKIPVIVNEGAALEWGLKINDEIDITVNNNTLSNSYDLLNTMIGMDENPINNKFKLVVKGICTDSFGTKIYCNQKVANQLIGIDKVAIIEKMNDDSIERKKIIDDKPFVPFNGIFSNSEKNQIGNIFIPFYSETGIWSFNTNLNFITNINVNQTVDAIVTEDEQILKLAAKTLNIDINNPNLRDAIKNEVAKILNISYFKQILNVVQGDASLALSIKTMMPDNIRNQIFDIISNLITTTIYILVGILIPLLLIIIFIVSFSMIEDLFKKIALMKVLGINFKEINRIILFMYIPIIILITLIGVGLMFGCTYGLQYLIFNVTSIFISEMVSAPIFFIGFSIILLFFILSIVFMYIKLKRKNISDAVKF